MTGWTGYDCSTPICVQASNYYVNVNGKSDPGFVPLGGHGGDHLMTCLDKILILPRPECVMPPPDHNQ